MVRRVLLALCLLAPASALAVPDVLVHQGKLLDSTGDPVEGTHTLTVSVYDARTGGNVVWSTTEQVVFDRGFYTLDLIGLGPTELTGELLYVALSLDGGAEIGARLALNSVAYAVRAQVATDVDGGIVDASEIRIGGVTVIDDSGTIVSGASDTLGELSCLTDQLALYDGNEWKCAPNVHSADEIVSGVLDVDRLPLGTGASDVAAGNHDHPAADIVSGTLDIGRLPVGPAATQVARGDHGHVGADITGGTISVDRLPVGTTNTTVARGAHEHDGADIVTGTIAVSRLPVGTGSGQVAPGVHTHPASQITGLVDEDTLATLGCDPDQLPLYDGGTWTCVDYFHDGADIVSGTVGFGRLPVGTTTGTVAEGKHTHTDADLVGTIDADTVGGLAPGDLVGTETFLRGAALTSGATVDGMALSSGKLVLTNGGFGAGVTDLLVTPANSPYVLPPGVHEFRDVTVQSGATLTTSSWNGLEGGLLDIRATGTVTIAGTVDLKAKGYRGGLTRNVSRLAQWIALTWNGSPGESWSGYGFWMLGPIVANGGGGAGGDTDSCSYGNAGGGGGYGTAGAAGIAVDGGNCPSGLAGASGSSLSISGASDNSPAGNAPGGAVYGDAAISRLWLGSGGGGAGSDSDGKDVKGGNGGNGGGAFAVRARAINVTGTIDVSGENGKIGVAGNNGGGGGGSGGSVKLVGNAVTVSGSLKARGGTGGPPGAGTGSNTGGQGGDGRIRIEGTTIANTGTMDVASQSVVSSVTQATPGDGTRGTWTSPLISFQGDGRFKSIDLFATTGEGVSVSALLCTGATAGDADVTANCSPIAPSGAVDAPSGAGYGKVRLTVVDRSGTGAFSLHGIRAAFGS